MPDPYRTLVEADSASVVCTSNPEDGRFHGACRRTMPPHPPFFPAIVVHALGAITRPSAAGYPRAVSLAATVLLLVASASMSAMTWSVVTTQLGQHPESNEELLLAQTELLRDIVKASKRSETTQAQAHATPPAAAPKPPPPHVEAAAPPHALLAHLGPETHAVDELWQRAEHLAGSGSDVTLVRTTLARQAAGALMTSGLRIDHAQAPGGFTGVHLLDAGQRFSAPALAGLRSGDWVEAINGFRLDAPVDMQRAYEAIEGQRNLVLEIVRDGRRIALRVEWRA